MYEELIQNLRSIDEYDTGYAKLIYDAADAIEELSYKYQKSVERSGETGRAAEGGMSMGFYVDLEMPKDCPMCPFAHYDMFNTFRGCDITRGKRWAVKNDKDYAESSTRPDWCPLIEVHELHGRLIDADALMLKIREYIDEYGELDENGFHSEKWCAMKEAEMAACETPTVIPASESKERPAFLPQYELTPRSKEG